MKLVLDTNQLTEHFFDGAKLLGIMAPMKDYQFCWQINNWLGIDFRINNEIEIQLTRKGRNYFFSVFEWAEPSNCLMHYLYNNQHMGEYLLPELKHFDFLWLMKDDYIADDMLQQLTKSVREMQGVQMVAELTNEKIKNKEHLVF